MKFNHNQELDNYLEELISKHQLNLSISDLLLSLLNNPEITSKKEIELLKAKFNIDEHQLFLDKISQYLDIDFEVEDNEEIYQRFIANQITSLNEEDYLNNPYYQNIKIKDYKYLDFELKMDKYFPYELFAYLDMDYVDNYEINSLGYFKNEFKFIALNYKNVTWMSITPNEIETMKKPLEIIKGDVTIFGLGLGYFAYMALLKKEVNHIKIIEIDKNIIKIFKDNLLPQFPNKEKLEIIEADALNYINKDINSDYAFVDLWHSPSDGLKLYLKFKKKEHVSRNTKFIYWIESSLLIYLKRLMLTLIEELLEGDNPNNYIKAKTFEDQIINRFYRNTKDLIISNKADVINLLQDNNLIRLALDDR